jgi:hypothetical protein
MKKIILIGIVVVCVVCVFGALFYRTPEHLASQAKYIPEFFNLTKTYFDTDNPGFCIDDIYSQGRKFEDFGSAGYLIDIRSHSSKIIEELRCNNNAVITDSTISLTVVRGNIKGTFTINNDTTRASVFYDQIYDD